jgi:hypothetical protein
MFVNICLNVIRHIAKYSIDGNNYIQSPFFSENNFDIVFCVRACVYVCSFNARRSDIFFQNFYMNAVSLDELCNGFPRTVNLS